MPRKVEKAEFKIGIPTLRTALYALSSLVPLPESAMKAWTMCALKSIQNPILIIIIIMLIVLIEILIKLSAPIRPNMMENIVSRMTNTDMRSGINMIPITNMA